MLVLSRKQNEKIVIDDRITVTVIDVRGDRVRLGIEAPREVGVHRREVWAKIQQENAAVSSQPSAVSQAAAPLPPTPGVSL